MLTAKDIHIGDLLKMTSKYPDDRFNQYITIVKSVIWILRSHFE